MVAKSKYFSGQDVLPGDVNNTEDTKIDEIQERSLAHSSARGVAFGMALSNPGGGTTIRISPGQAIDDDDHERIEIIANEDIVIAGVGDEGRFVVVEYTAASGTPVSHPITGASNDTRQTDGFTASIVDSRSETDAQVVLGEIDDTNGGAGPITFILTPREELTSRIADDSITDEQLVQADGVITHINTLGTGTPDGDNPHGIHVDDIDGFVEQGSNETHQNAQHASGLLAVSNAIQPAVVSGPPDSLSFSPDLSGTDRLWVKGKEFSALASTTLTFVDNNTVELWTILIDNTATPVKSLRLDKTVAAVPDVTGVKIVKVSRHTPAVAAVILSFASTGSTVSWNGGAAVPIVTNGGQYRLYSGTANGLDETHYVDVQVTSPLPGSAQTDTYEVFALHVEDDFYEVGRVVFNTAAAIEFLIDSREFGVTGAKEVLNNTFDDERKQPQHVAMAGVAADGVVSGLEVSDGSTTFDVGGGFAILDGRLIFFAGDSIGVGGNGTNYLILDSNPDYSSGNRHRVGAVQLSVTNVADPRTLLRPGTSRFILLAIGEVSGGTIDSIQDTRPFPYRMATDLQPDEDGVFSGSPKFNARAPADPASVVTIGDNAILDFESGAELANMPVDSVDTDAIQNFAVTEPKLAVDLVTTIVGPIQNRVLPVSPSNTLVYEPTDDSSNDLIVHSFPMIINGVFVPGNVISPSAGSTFTLELDNTVHRTVDGDLSPASATQWYHIYAEKTTVGGLHWEPRVAVVAGIHDPDYFGVHPSNPDFRWIGTIRTRAAVSRWTPMYKFMDGTVLIFDDRIGDTGAGQGTVWSIFELSPMGTSWVDDDLAVVDLVPYTARAVMISLRAAIPTGVGGDINTRFFFAPGGLFSGSSLGGIDWALRKDDFGAGDEQMRFTKHMTIPLNPTGEIQYIRDGDEDWDIGAMVIGYQESPLF